MSDKAIRRALSVAHSVLEDPAQAFRSYHGAIRHALASGGRADIDRKHLKEIEGVLGKLYPAGSGYEAKGKPSTVKLPGMGEYEARPIPALEEAKKKFISGHAQNEFSPFNVSFAQKVAKAFDRMKDRPNDPKVKRAYDALIEETLSQYRAAVDAGMDFRFLKEGEKDPYAASPALGYADVVKHGKLHVFPTDQGFGSIESEGNPLLKRVGKIGDLPNATANDAFRAVHDVFGHFGPGNPFFRAPGEERAYQLHARMYSPEARKALASETRGQNSWVNYGPAGDVNRKASGADTIYAPQKAGILPEWAQGEPKARGGKADKDIRRALMIARASSGGYAGPGGGKYIGPSRLAVGGRADENDDVWWHGSGSGDLRGGKTGLHLGTRAAAEDALNARIGIPVEGSWDGTREYGKTKLAGKNTILKRNPYDLSGHNATAPDEDYFPHEHPDGMPAVSGQHIPMEPHWKPNIAGYRIKGVMTNTVRTPHGDWKANGYMKGALKRGNAKRGYFYRNEGEDAGSISAVVPSGAHVEPLKRATGGRIGYADGGDPQSLSSIIQRGQPISPTTRDPTPDEIADAMADTRTGGEHVNRRLDTIVPERARVAGGTYTPGAPGGGRWADAQYGGHALTDIKGLGFPSLTDADLKALWEKSVRQSSAAARKAVEQHDVKPTFHAQDWHKAMSLPLRDHLWYELSGEKMAENLPDLSPEEHMKMLDILGATSARAKPGENLERTLATLSQHMRKAPVDIDLTIPSTVQQALKRSGHKTSALPGNKTGHFSDTLALAGGIPTRFPISVNDVWVGKMFGVPDDVMSSNQSLHEPMAHYFNNLRDLYNERHGKELPFTYQSWNFQAPAWVHLRGEQSAAESGDAYHQVWGNIVNKLRAAGVPGIDGDKITREALMHFEFADALRKQTKGFRNAPKATIELGTTQTPVGKRAHELYQQAIESGDKLSQQEYLKGLTTAMYASARGKNHPWDRLKKAITGNITGSSDITRIMSPTTEAPLDIGGTFEGAVSPNIRIPLKDMDTQHQHDFNAIAGALLKQDAMAVSHIVGADHGTEPREGYVRGHSIFVPTMDAMAPEHIRAFAKELAPEGHNMSYVRYPNGYHFDILPSFNSGEPRGIDAERLDEAYGKTLKGLYGPGEIVPHDFNSAYTESADYGKVRSNLLERMKNEYIEQAAKAGHSREAALAALEAPENDLSSGGKRARDVYRARLDHLAGAEQGLREIARKVEDAHSSFIGRAEKRFSRSAAKTPPGLPRARGGETTSPAVQRALRIAQDAISRLPQTAFARR